MKRVKEIYRVNLIVRENLKPQDIHRTAYKFISRTLHAEVF